MLFTYTYRSSDGQRHSAEIEAESRDAAFAAIRRELGVKPIKVVAAEGAQPPAVGKGAAAAGLKPSLVAAGVLIAAVLGGGVWWLAGRGRTPAQFTVNTPQGPVTYTVATPLPRQGIPGDRRRIEAAMGIREADGRGGAFANPAERLLARFAEPGRTVPADAAANPGDDEFREALRRPVRIASTDFTEAVDLKRIVAGMKREMAAYLAGGGKMEQYLSELVKRQRLEISYRENAEKRLSELLGALGAGDGGNASVKTSSAEAKKAAYAYWLKANASLKSMGIYELPLPDALHGYQAGLGLDE